MHHPWLRPRALRRRAVLGDLQPKRFADGFAIEEGIAVSYDPSFDNTPGGRPDDSDAFGPATIVGKVVYFRASDDD